MTFSYSDDRMTISYKGAVVKGRGDIPDVETVADEGSFFVTIKGSKQSGENGLNNFLDDTRCDVVTKEHRAYIQDRINDKKFPEDTKLEVIGNYVCEIYHGMII